jgi:hypothetical protein
MRSKKKIATGDVGCGKADRDAGSDHLHQCRPYHLHPVSPAGGGQLLFAGTKDNSITIQEPEDRFITSMGGASFDATRA